MHKMCSNVWRGSKQEQLENRVCTCGQAEVVVIRHVLPGCAGDGVVVLQQSHRQLQPATAGLVGVRNVLGRSLSRRRGRRRAVPGGQLCYGLNLGASEEDRGSVNGAARGAGGRAEDLHLARGLQEGGAGTYVALGRRPAREVACEQPEATSVLLLHLHIKLHEDGVQILHNLHSFKGLCACFKVLLDQWTTEEQEVLACTGWIEEKRLTGPVAELVVRIGEEVVGLEGP